MAVAPYTTLWNITDGPIASDTLCAGCFQVGATGTNKTYQAATTHTNVTILAGGMSISSTQGFDNTDVGNYIWIPSSAGFAVKRYRIASVAGGNATLDESPGSAGTSGGTGYLGGAMRSPGGCAGAIGSVIYQTVYWTGIHVATNDTNNVANGRITLTEGSQWIGYHAVPGDNVFSSTMLPVFSKTAAVGTLPLIVNWTNTHVRNARFEIGNFQLYNNDYIGGMFTRCWIEGGRLSDTVGIGFNQCYLNLTGSSGGVTINGTAARQLFFNRCCVKIATTINAMIYAVNSIFETTASPSTLILGTASTTRMFFQNCALITQNGSILDSTTSSNTMRNVVFDRCILWNNALSLPVIRTNEEHAISLRNCAYPSTCAPTHDSVSELLPNVDPVALAANPFVNTPAGDYSLTSVAKPLLRIASEITPGIPGFSQFGWVGAEPIAPVGGFPRVLVEGT